MVATGGKLRYSIILLILPFWTHKCNSHDFRCPKQPEWSFKARTKCGDELEYFCILDGISNNYTEFCKENPDITRDITWKKGQKCVLKGNLDGEVCSSNRYQPFKFRTHGNSYCAYKKSFCQEEGMLIYNNGSATLDTQCRCDHTKGFAFVSMTRQNCFCIPSQEDCTCYKKACENKTKLSSAYKCIFHDSQADSSACPSLDTR
ncbi:Hypothetical predicted protein [Mytilus galloprovincialis]|uniref:Uncharacterized protein n=1 Tax=Mytilus galloprovincialis TaxID=29158 RepID=A0A8B6H9J8_MYTGA|nr:Hypothetical predicted protein [Mytilus galloprovincialis]